MVANLAKLFPCRMASRKTRYNGRLAQLVAHHIDIVEATGSSPVPPTTFDLAKKYRGSKVRVSRLNLVPGLLGVYI